MNDTCSCSITDCHQIGTIALHPKARTWYSPDCARRLLLKIEADRRELADDQYVARVEHWPVENIR